MKKILSNITKSFLPLLVMGMIASCGEEHDFYSNIDYVPDNVANVKFINTAIGAVTGTTAVSVPVNYFINDVKVSSVNVATGLQTVGMGFNATFPASINYGLVPAGAQQTLKAITPSVTSSAVPPVVTPAVEVTTGTITTEAGKHYSNFLVGTTAGYSNYFIEDDFSFANADLTKAYVRFVNTVNNTPAGGYTVIITKTYAATTLTPSKATDLLTFSGVNYISGSTKFVPIEAAVSGTSDTYTITMKQGTITVGTAITSLTFRPGRVYTLYAKGDNNLTGTTWSPNITFYTNR